MTKSRRKPKTPNTTALKTAIGQLLRRPPQSPVDLRLRLMMFDVDDVRDALARRLIGETLSGEDALRLIQWLMEFGTGNSAVPLLDLVGDPREPLDRRVPAFVLLSNSAPRELGRRMLSLPPQESVRLLEAAQSWIEGFPQEEVAREATPSRPSRTRVPRVVRLKITLRQVRPPVWRRFEVSDDVTLAQLHHIVQDIMGWTNSHLHAFRVGEIEYGVPDPEWPNETKNEKRVRLRDLVDDGVKRFRYAYDFGDGWEHDIVVERVSRREPGLRLPRCLAGKRACPPEDCGGPWGYQELLEVLADPDHSEHEESRSWAGAFEAEAFDLDEVNAWLGASRKSK